MRGSIEPVKREPPGRPAKPPDPGDVVGNMQPDRATTLDGQTTVDILPSLNNGAKAVPPEPTVTKTEVPISQGISTSGAEHSLGEPTQEGDKQKVRPMDMFKAVMEAMKAAPDDPPHDAWIATVVELYSLAHATVKIAVDLVPPGKTRYPTLRSDEKSILFKFFEEACIVGDGSFEQWVKYAQTMTHDLYNTSGRLRTFCKA